MYALAIIRYRRPLEDVLKHLEAHRAHLRELKSRGVLIASGPFEPRNGGGLLLRVPDGRFDATLDAIYATRIRSSPKESLSTRSSPGAPTSAARVSTR